MGNAIFRGLPTFSKKFARLIMSGTPPHMQVLGSVGSKGACLRMREIVALRRLFFLVFRFLAPRSATDRPVGPIIAINRSNDAPWWRSCPFMVLLKKFCTVDYVGNPTSHASIGVSRFKGCVSAQGGFRGRRI